MARVPMWRRYLRFWGSDLCADVDAELEGHLDMLVEALRGRGDASGGRLGSSAAAVRRHASRAYRVFEGG